jgi:hypothetical protein
MRKVFTISIVLVAAIVAAMSWCVFSKRPSPYVVPITGDNRMYGMTTQQDMATHPVSNASDVVVKASPILLEQEQTGTISEAVYQPITNAIHPAVFSNHPAEIIEPKGDSPNVNEISQEKALDIARGAIGKTKYARELPVVVKDGDGEYRVIFPVNKTVPPGTRYRGPDYAAEVRIDKKTAKVIQVRVGE